MSQEKYVQGNVPYGYSRILATCKLRSGKLKQAAFVKVDPENRICKLCEMNIVENQINFLTECPLYEDFMV